MKLSSCLENSRAYCHGSWLSTVTQVCHLLFFLFFQIKGMEHADIGPTHVNNFFLSSLNVPPVSERTLKNREREIGPVIEQLAKESYWNAAGEGKLQTNEGGITISYDMGWQKRGRAMNSLTSVGHAVGCSTGKVVSYATQSKHCATCATAERLEKEPGHHDCWKKIQSHPRLLRQM